MPVVVKPSHEGSSVGITRVRTHGDLADAVALAARYDGELVIEQMIVGEEYTVGILQGEALPSIRIVPKGEFYDYHAKYVADDTKYICPGLDEAGEREIQALAMRAFDAIGCARLGPRRPDARSRRQVLPARSQHDAGHDESFARAEGRARGRHRVRGAVLADSGNELRRRSACRHGKSGEAGHRS